MDAARRLNTVTVAASMLLGAGVAGAQTTISLDAAADNTLFESLSLDALSSGAGDAIFLGQTIRQAERRRGLVRFDLTSIPPNAVVTSVSLRLTQVRAVSEVNEQLVSFHRMMRAWGEGASASGGGAGAPAQAGDATWLLASFPGVAWTTPGGDFVASASHSQAATSFFETQLVFSGPGLASDVQGWLNAPATNFGWVVRGREAAAAGARAMASRENLTVANRPRLSVTYVLACGASDVAGPDQSAGADGQLTADDIIVFLNGFFAADARSDVAGPGPSTVPDTEFTADDIIVFLNRFFAGC